MQQKSLKTAGLAQCASVIQGMSLGCTPARACLPLGWPTERLRRGPSYFDVITNDEWMAQFFNVAPVEVRAVPCRRHRLRRSVSLTARRRRKSASPV